MTKADNLVKMLEELASTHLKLKEDGYPFNERELAKAELVFSLLKKLK